MFDLAEEQENIGLFFLVSGYGLPISHTSDLSIFDTRSCVPALEMTGVRQDASIVSLRSHRSIGIYTTAPCHPFSNPIRIVREREHRSG